MLETPLIVKVLYLGVQTYNILDNQQETKKKYRDYFRILRDYTLGVLGL
jgi:hypothetical protein